jgi:hypothetical protein
MTTSGLFKNRQAPCGRVVDGETYQDDDPDAVITQAIDYVCGCRCIQHEYHDGTISRMVVRHDGRVLVDELMSAE